MESQRSLSTWSTITALALGVAVLAVVVATAAMVLTVGAAQTGLDDMDTGQELLATIIQTRRSGGHVPWLGPLN